MRSTISVRHAYSNASFVFFLSTAVVCATLSTAVFAQDLATRSEPQAQPTTVQGPPAEFMCTSCGIPMASVPFTPPKDFDPLTASNAALIHYGFLPRPDPQQAPGAYANWKRFIAASVIRVIPELQPLTIYNGPPRALSVGKTLANGSASFVAPNWSGFAVVDPNNPFIQGPPEINPWITIVNAWFIVPFVTQPSGTCTITSSVASFWVGLDGMTVPGSSSSSDVLQAGVTGTRSCISIAANYFAWYEWYPNAAVSIRNFHVAPGDYIGVSVYNTSSTQGFFALANATTGEYIPPQPINPPRGTSLVGNSVEWIVERPSNIFGTPVTLAKYKSTGWNFCDAWHVNTGYWPTPGGATTGTMYSITMQQNNAFVSKAWGSASNSFVTIDPQYGNSSLNGSGIWFRTDGPGY